MRRIASGLKEISASIPSQNHLQKYLCANARASAPAAQPEDLQREYIDFNSKSPAGLQFLAFSTATGLSRFTDVPWPKALAPKPATKLNRKSSDPLPKADVLMVTWTVDEGHALSRVLTPGKDTHNDYLSYTNNCAAMCEENAPRLSGARSQTHRGVFDNDDR